MPTAFYGTINREGRNEFQLFIAGLCALSGVAQFVTGQVTPVLEELGPTFQFLWASTLIGGGLLLLVSAVWKKATPMSTWLEMGGLFTLGLSCGAFSILNFLSVGFNSFSAWPILAVALAMLSRLRRVAHVHFREETDYHAKLQTEVAQQLYAKVAEDAKIITPTPEELRKKTD